MTAAQHKVIETLIAEGGELLFAELLEAAAASASTIQTLERRGLLEVFVREVRRDPLAGARLPNADDLRLTAEQETALRSINEAQNEDAFAAFLLHGVTGSGKTEIYIRAMREALRRGRTAMMLVPEIALTPVFSRRLRAHFGDAVAIFHSSLTAGERFDEWGRLKRGEARVVIGTRSAVFAPVREPGRHHRGRGARGLLSTAGVALLQRPRHGRHARAPRARRRRPRLGHAFAWRLSRTRNTASIVTYSCPAASRAAPWRAPRS